MASKRPIIVEGPDGGGKTRLALDLRELYGLEYRRPPAELLSSDGGPVGLERLTEWWDTQLGLPMTILRCGVYDRCTYISDPIYRQAQPERDLFMPSEHLTSGIMKLWTVEPILIFCLPPFEAQLQNVASGARVRLQDVNDKSLEKISNAYWAYYAMWSNSLPEGTVMYDYTDPSAYEHLTRKLANLGCEEA